jgi:predicted phage-related endonuclease
MKNLSTYPASQFHERRMKGIGGSDISAIMGVNPWKSPLDVYLDKVGESEPIPDNFPMRLGRAMEVTLRQSYNELHDVEIVFSGDAMMIFEDGIFYHHPDGIAGYDADGSQHLWEAKSSSRYSAWKNGPPIEVVMQCQWGLFLSGLPKCVISLSLGSREYREFEILPDQKMQKEMMVAAHLFWMDHVEKKIPPDPSGSDSDRVWLDEAFDEAETVAPLTADLIHLGGLRLIADNKVKTWAAQRDETDQKIMKLMGDHSAAAGDNFKVTWKRPKDRETLDKKVLREKLGAFIGPDMLEGIFHDSMKSSEQKRRFLFKEVDNAS